MQRQKGERESKKKRFHFRRPVWRRSLSKAEGDTGLNESAVRDRPFSDAFLFRAAFQCRSPSEADIAKKNRPDSEPPRYKYTESSPGGGLFIGPTMLVLKLSGSNAGAVLYS